MKCPDCWAGDADDGDDVTHWRADVGLSESAHVIA